MALLVIPAGMFIAPLLATRNELIGWVAPAGSRTEAYTWPVTAFVGGIAIGAALAGTIVEQASWRTAFLVAGRIRRRRHRHRGVAPPHRGRAAGRLEEQADQAAAGASSSPQRSACV